MAQANGHVKDRLSGTRKSLRRLQADARRAVAHPQHLRGGLPARGGAPLRRGHGRRAARRRASRTSQVLEIPDVHPYVYGDWLHKPGAPTILLYGHHDVQPPGRPEKWLSPGLRAHRAQRPALRPRHRRRQGRRAWPTSPRWPSYLKSARRAALQREVRHRGRGGDRLREPRPLPREVQGHDGGRLHRALRHRELRHRHPRAHLPAARHLPGGRRGAVPRPSGAQRHVGRPGARSRCRSSAGSSPTSRTRTAR